MEQSYYCKILEDINQDVLQIEKHILENGNRIKNNNDLLQLLQKKFPDPSKMVNILRRSITKTGSIFKPSKAAFDDLKSSGNLKIIKDQEIKDELINYYSTMESYIDVIFVNSHYTVETYYNSNKNFADLGWQNIDYVKAEIDASMIDIEALNISPYPPPKLRKQLISDAIFYLTTNSRKKRLYAELAEQVYKMQERMSDKCKQE